MNNQDNIKKHHQQIVEAHQEICLAVGEYIFSFENLFSAIKSGIEELLFMHMTFNNPGITNIIIADLTADPLLKKFDGLLAITFHEKYNEPNFKKQYTKLYKSIKVAIEYRNKVAHAQWYFAIDYNIDEEEESKLKTVGKLYRIKKGKGAVNPFEENNIEIIDELKKNTQENFKILDYIIKIATDIQKNKSIDSISLDRL